MDYEINPAKPSDASAIHTMILELARFEKAEDQVEVTPEVLEAHLSMKPPPFYCLIARFQSDAIGFALYFQSYSTWRGKPGIWLEDLYVKPSYRRQGVGQGLFDALMTEVEALDGGRLEWPVLEWNQDAHRFYENQGAIPLREWRTWRLERP